MPVSRSLICIIFIARWHGCEELPEKEQDGRTPFSPRCVKDVVEERLFTHRRDLLTRLDLVFMDTTSLYFEGAGGRRWVGTALARTIVRICGR